MPSFEGLPPGGVRVRLDPDEAELLRRLCGEMRSLYAGGLRQTDPVIARLFPPAYESLDDEAAYRELIGDDLHDHKLQGLAAMAAGLGERGRVDLDLAGGEAETWLAVLTDIRLAIGTRLDVDEERMGAELDPQDPDAPALSVLHWLGLIQQLLLEALAAKDPDAG